MSLLEVEQMSVAYGDVQVLEEISLRGEEREIVSIVGGNGTGKTTIIRTLSGSLLATAGSIKFAGEEVGKSRPHERVERGLVQIPEGRRLFPYMTVLGNLDMGSYALRARKGRREALHEVFSLFPILEERKNQIARTLSGGEQQMLAIGRGLMAFPRLLMLDEPSLGLAPMVVKLIFETVRQINSRGITILLVEQNVKQSLEISNRGYVLENGRIIMEGPGAEILKNDHLRKAYLGL